MSDNPVAKPATYADLLATKPSWGDKLLKLANNYRGVGEWTEYERALYNFCLTLCEKLDQNFEQEKE